ncbi:hypothetical protein KDA_40180 [Dictyobacter alpinus]|uniref:histidine kinase n=1 Tax=Dictyobacter alpinus TaxID=2014873 RepID=A0A402BB16_9CHLR|nr:HAMP domain-containing sensor histidine kinase [Dictyobacter alpinus]GCE28534.1 hypothetical protein KDA_40180 [Dictyobacter alpinus]
MGTQRITLTRPAGRRTRFVFAHLFAWYFLGTLLTTIVLTCILEVACAYLVALSVQGSSIFAHNRPFQIVCVALLVVLPFIVLGGAILFFANLLRRKIHQPVSELMQAVEKIRQQDLNFSIDYQGRNELGDLCVAFNQLRLELQESLEREWRKQEEMHTMMAVLSHDLRTPITIIQGHIEGLMRVEAGQKRNERLNRYLPVLESNSQRMTRLLNDMLLVVSLEQVGFVIQPEYVWLEDELERKVQIYRLQASAHEVRFEYSYTSPIGKKEQVCIDLHRIEQVLDNLIENALRYTPVHGIVQLSCTNNAHILSLVVSDTGCGIAPQDLPHVFEKFYQGSQQLGDRVRQAAGLGLHACKLLIEKQGGSITLQNRSTGGCEIAIALPLQQAAGPLELRDKNAIP